MKKNLKFSFNQNENNKINLFNNFIFFLAILLFFNSCTEKSNKKSNTNKKVIDNNYCLNIENLNQFSATLSTNELFNKKHERINLLKFDTLDTIGRSWHLKIEMTNNFKLDTLLKVRSKSEFKKMINNCFFKIPHESPKNANYLYKNNKFEPIEAVNGNQIDTSKLNKLIFDAISKKSEDLSLTYENSYLKPSYFLSHEKSLAGLKELKKCVKSSIIFKIKYGI